MPAARAAEAEFFASHPEYAEVGSQCGTANLARTLNRILVEHIRSLLPSLRSAIEDALDKRAAELMSYGEAPVGDTNASRYTMVDFLTHCVLHIPCAVQTSMYLPACSCPQVHRQGTLAACALSRHGRAYAARQQQTSPVSGGVSDCCFVARGALLLQLLDAYSVRYTQMLEGCSEHMPVTELAGGARIRHIFQDIFMKGLDQLNPSRLRPCLHDSLFFVGLQSCCWNAELATIISSTILNMLYLRCDLALLLPHALSFACASHPHAHIFQLSHLDIIVQCHSLL